MKSLREYKYLAPKLGSTYEQLYVKGRRIQAEVLYEETLEPNARTPKQVADDFNVPLEAVLESIEYCKENWDLITREWEEDTAMLRAAGILPLENGSR